MDTSSLLARLARSVSSKKPSNSFNFVAIPGMIYLEEYILKSNSPSKLIFSLSEPDLPIDLLDVMNR